MQQVRSILEQIDQWGEQKPDRIVYDYLGQQFTYRQLQIYSDNIAHYLMQQKLPIGSPVIVYGGQTFSMLACFLGVVKAGHPYIPVDEQSSPQRLVDISQRSGAKFCLALANLPVDLENINLVKDEKIEKIFAAAHQNVDKKIFTQGTDIFYIIYTSGTTGKPKGVQISHDNLLDFVRWMNSSFDLKPNECCLLQPSFSFDLSVMALYPSLVAGRKNGSLASNSDR